MFTSAKLLYIKAKKFHRELYQQLLDLQSDLAQTTDEIELADIAYVLRETVGLIEDIRKEMNKVGKVAKLRACQSCIEDLNNVHLIKTQYVTASPDIKMYVPFPTSKKKEGWDEFMTYLGIPSEVQDKELVRPHYNSMVEWCSELSRTGSPLPPGLDPSKQVPQYDLKMTKVRGVKIA